MLSKGGSSKAIGLRTDMDALQVLELNTFDYRSQHEGKMHACGHDGHTAIKGDCRSFQEGVSLQIEEAMERLVQGICAAHGAEYDVAYQRLFPPTINSKHETDQAIQAAQATVGVDNTDPQCEPLTISEDFASMLKEKPGCYIFIGNGEDSQGGCMLHNPHYDFNDDILQTGCQYWVNLVQQQLFET